MPIPISLFHEALGAVLQATRWWLLLLFLLPWGIAALWPGHPTWEIWLFREGLIVGLVQVGLWGTPLLRLLVRHLMLSTEDETRLRTLRTLWGPTSWVVIGVWWSALLLIALDALGVNTTAFITGLGVGGVIMALAVQKMLEDVLATLSIMLDQPFAVGDYIVLTTDQQGTVAHIGLRSTQIHHLNGEMLIISNSDLLKSRIRNFQHLQERRAVLSCVVAPQTAPEILAQLPQAWTEALSALSDVRLERVHLKRAQPNGYEYEMVFFVTVPDYAVFMDRQQAAWLAIVTVCQAHGASLAFPAQGAATV